MMQQQIQNLRMPRKKTSLKMAEKEAYAELSLFQKY